MNKTAKPGSAPLVRCAIYTRKSTEEGLEQAFNSLDAQREASEAYIASQKNEGWTCLETRYDDGGFTGGNMDRPALQRLLADIDAGQVDSIVVYKLDRFSRSLLDFAKMMETLDKHQVAFVSITQQFSTGTSMGRLVLNVLYPSPSSSARSSPSGRGTRSRPRAARASGPAAPQSWATTSIPRPTASWSIRTRRSGCGPSSRFTSNTRRWCRWWRS